MTVGYIVGRCNGLGVSQGGLDNSNEIRSVLVDVIEVISEVQYRSCGYVTVLSKVYYYAISTCYNFSGITDYDKLWWPTVGSVLRAMIIKSDTSATCPIKSGSRFSQKQNLRATEAVIRQ